MIDKGRMETKKHYEFELAVLLFQEAPARFPNEAHATAWLAERGLTARDAPESPDLLWVAQCVNYDLVASGNTKAEAMTNLIDTFFDRALWDLERGELPLESVPPAPQVFADRFEAAVRESEGAARTPRVTSLGVERDGVRAATRAIPVDRLKAA